MKSDPRKVYAWVMRQVSIFGPQYIRICRYLKAWRDEQWKQGGPSSILLMVCASQAIQSHAARDDKALLGVAKDLTRQLSGGVCNPDVDATAELNDLSQEERQVASAKARMLAGGLQFATEQAPDAGTAIARLTTILGSRVPNRPDWVQEVTPSNIVQATPAAVVGAPAVKRARSA